MTFYRRLYASAAALLPLLTLVPSGWADGRLPLPATAHYDRSADPHRLIRFMEQGGWCWFQDPRAVVLDDYLVMGAVRGNRNGEARIGVYDLRARKPLEPFIAQTPFNADDHNSPVFFERSDGSLLATYALHGGNRYHYSRISEPNDPTRWHAEFRSEREVPNPKDDVTYMNLIELPETGRLYNFFRQIEYNPTFVVSDDEGLTWSDPVHFIANVEGGRHRPYVRYVGDGKRTIHVSLTDAHPRNFGNNLYYVAFRDGNYYRADGSLIKNLEADGPLTLDEAERIYRGSNQVWTGDRLASVPDAAWTSSIALDAGGHPHIGYSLYLSNRDNRYRLASWNGREWIDREIAYAGTCLYDAEASYTGLVTLDPLDPSVVFISTNVDPSTGEALEGPHEIYRARIGPSDTVATIKWTAVTSGSPVANIRPLILHHDGQRIVIWLRGDYQTWKDYDLDKVGLIEPVQR